MADPAEPADPASYRFRANALVYERAYRLAETGIAWSEPKTGLSGSVAYSDIREVRLNFAPMRAHRNRFIASVRTKRGEKLSFCNLDYRGLAELTEQNEAYEGFIRALHARLAPFQASIVFRKGSSIAGYVANMFFSLITFAGLAFSLFFVINFDVSGLIFVKLAIILFFVPTLILFMIRSAPARYDPAAIPAGMLPLSAATSLT